MEVHSTEHAKQGQASAVLGSALFGFLCASSVFSVVSVVVVSHIPITTETQRTQSLHREEIELGHYPVLLFGRLLGVRCLGTALVRIGARFVRQ